MCAHLPQDQTKTLLQSEHDFDALPEALLSLGLNRQNIRDPYSYSQAPQDDVSNEVVVALSQFMTKYNKSSNFVRIWLMRLSLACKEMSDVRLRTLVPNALKIHKQLSKNSKRNELEHFLKRPFCRTTDERQTQCQEVRLEKCHHCHEKDAIIEGQEMLIKTKDDDICRLRTENACLVSVKQELDSTIVLKNEVILEIQNDKKDIANELHDMKLLAAEVPLLKRKMKEMQRNIEEVSNTKLYYKRNAELKDKLQALEVTAKKLEEDLKLQQTSNTELKKKIKSEQDMKHRYRKKLDVLSEENTLYLSEINREKVEDDITLTQREDKCTMYSDNIRELYMALQGEANVAASQASKVVMLVAKHLFQKDLPLNKLPCPRTCLNFMEEANHIAKQHIVSQITGSKHFTYASDIRWHKSSKTAFHGTSYCS